MTKILCRGNYLKKARRQESSGHVERMGKQRILAGSSIWGLVTDNSNGMLELGHGECLSAGQRDRTSFGRLGRARTGHQGAWSCRGSAPIRTVTLVL